MDTVSNNQFINRIALHHLYASMQPIHASVTDGLTFDLEQALKTDGNTYPEPKKVWSFGLCDLFTYLIKQPMCISVSCCSPCTSIQLCATLDKVPSLIYWTLFFLSTIAVITEGVLSSLQSESSIMTASYIQLSISSFVFLVVWKARATMRKQREIAGNGCDDCCVSFWCSPCALCQMFMQPLANNRGDYASNYNGPFQYPLSE